MYRTLKINALWPYRFVLHCISHCRTNTCTQTPLVSPGNISTVSAKNGVEQMASEWLKPPTMVPTTSLSFYPTLPPHFSLLNPPHRSHVPIVWIHHRSLFNAILARCSCQRGSGSLEAPWSDTKSAKRRKRVGRRTRRRRKVGESGGKGSGAFPPPPPTWNHFKLCYF